MKTRIILLTLVFCLSAVVASFASDANVGSWKLNDAKSKIPDGVGKNTSVVYTVEGDNLKCVVDGMDGKGQATHNEWTGKLDGKDYEITGDPISNSRAIKMLGKDSYKLTNKKDGKTTITGTIVTSADGKMRTLKTTSTDDKGKKVTATFVYDKQ